MRARLVTNTWSLSLLLHPLNQSISGAVASLRVASSYKDDTGLLKLPQSTASTKIKKKDPKPVPMRVTQAEAISSDDEPVRRSETMIVIADSSAELTDDGLRAADKDDGDLNQPTESESEASALQPSPRKSKAVLKSAQQPVEVVTPLGWGSLVDAYGETSRMPF